MSDFYQNGIITNLHNLRVQDTESLEKELLAFAKVRQMGLVLPSLYSELLSPALGNIVKELKDVKKALGNVVDQTKDVAGAVKGKKRRGRPKKS